jgi:streptogramin lyase
MSSATWVRPGVHVLLLILLVSLAAPKTVPGQVSAQVTSLAGGATLEWTGGYALVQHPVPAADAEPWSITTDPQGRAWFVEQGANALGMYDPSTGNFTQYPIPTPRSTPDAVASDSRGDIWFAELTSNKLGELAAGGAGIVEFPIPGEVVSVGALTQPVACGPGAVLADPSGMVWVACLFSNQIDRFDPALDAFASYDLPVFQSAPAGMALDGKGDLWFTAADANMLGKAVISQLQNGTDQGITEFAPLNQTYVFTYNHPTSFLGSTEPLSSSIQTPSGIALDPTGRLWITEHVDSSFDSYDPVTQSLVKYFTTQTFGAYGYPVTFPNGIAVAPSGAVWIGEHYGNRIAELIPSAGVMTEYPVPCCNSTIAGVYSVALGPDGRLWFVEIGGDAIGEVVPRSQLGLALSLPQTTFHLGTSGAASVPLAFTQSSASATTLSLSVSGVSMTGAPQNMTAAFDSSRLVLPPGGGAHADLNFTIQGLRPGVYYLSLGATTQAGVIYSAILVLSVTSNPPSPLLTLAPVAVAAAVAAGAAGWVLARRSRGGRDRRPFRASRKRTRTSAATPAPVTAYAE